MEANEKMTHKQYLAVIVISLLSPAMQFLPKSSLGYGAKAVWLSPFAAVLPMVILLLMMSSFLKNRRENEGLADVIIKSLGRVAGKTVLAVYGFWLIFYTGFYLRVSAERLLSSVYRSGGMTPFLIVGLLISFIAARGKIKSLGRVAKVLVLISGGMLVCILLFSMSELNPRYILPVSYLN